MRLRQFGVRCVVAATLACLAGALSAQQQCSPRERVELRKGGYDDEQVAEFCRRSSRPAPVSSRAGANPSRFCVTAAGSCRDSSRTAGDACVCFMPGGVFRGVAR